MATSYEQVLKFDPKKMGKKSGWCLQNCRLGFGIKTGFYSSAKADMLAQKKANTLHPFNTLPKNVAVPVYIDTSSSYEHVMVCDKGTWYSDGKKVSAPKASTVFGWGELCDHVRVVKGVSAGFLPTRGWWEEGDNDARIGKLSAFMYKTFPKYTNKKAVGNYFGKYLKRSVLEFQKRCGLYQDGCVGAKTYAKLKKFGFKA